MNIIVSTKLKDNFRGYSVVQSLSEIQKLSDVDCVIIHDFTDTEFNAGICLTNLHTKCNINNFIYISSQPLLTIKMMVDGLGGIYLEDEFYLDEEEELNVVVEDLLDNQSYDLMTTGTDIDVITDFLESFARGDSKINAPIYIENVNTAVSNLARSNEKQLCAIKDMGSTAVETFKRASDVISKLAEKNKELKDKLLEIENLRADNIRTSPRDNFGGGVSFFQTYNYTRSATVLLIREYSPCRFLTSFVRGYYNHIHLELNKKVKLIFIHQKGKCVTQKYDGFATSILQESMQSEDLYTHPIIATNNPKKSVMEKLMTQNDEVIIIVDRLYGQDDIVSARVTKVNAVSGFSDIARFNLECENTIFTMSSPKDCLCCIPVIKNYPQDVESRFAMYSKNCKEAYLALDAKLKLS